MKKFTKTTLVLLFLYICSSCSTQEITSSWVNREELSDEPYKSICIIALVPDRESKIYIEDEMVKLLNKGGAEGKKSIEIFAPKFTDEGNLTRERMIEIMKEAGCDGVLTITELDVKTESRYIPGEQPAPLPPYRYRYYNSYYSYYSYRYNQVYVPGHVVEETTYFFETNFYDLESEKLMWSIQSKAFEPSDVISWFNEFSKLIIKQLKKEDIIKT